MAEKVKVQISLCGGFNSKPFAKRVLRLTKAEGAMSLDGEFLNTDRPVELDIGAVIVSRQYQGMGSRKRAYGVVQVVGSDGALRDVLSLDDQAEWDVEFDRVREAITQALKPGYLTEQESGG